VLNNKKIQEEGTHNELLKKQGLYYTMWQTQKNAVGWQIEN
jgi:ATP-binding cassette subfamily B protein